MAVSKHAFLFFPLAVVIVNELRCEAVHQKFLELFGEAFTMKKVLHSQMHPIYQHPSVDIFILKKKKAVSTTEASEAAGRSIAKTAVHHLLCDC